jgi:dTDP-4-dehydrorhamnose 3,5-epimerase-like enzyme
MLHPKIRPVTEAEKADWPKSVIVPLEAPHVDERGAIQPLVDVPMESCVLISSKKGTVRANHYHQTDWHYCYVVEGEIDYYEKPHGSSQAAKKTVIRQGQMFFTGPMVDHAMVFTQDTTFITWGRNSRAQEVYEADVVRIPPINP